MPLTRISMRKGKFASYRSAIAQGAYEAMRETFDVPEEDLFVIVHELEPENLVIGRNYLDIERSDDLVILQITCNDNRTVEQKKALYAAVARRLQEDPGIRSEDIFINLLETQRENWSFGNGIAQYA
ncbi:MAG TPA: tautomerase family protein [Sphingomicrobium sp.]|nr:tautomerase family protein [Sphingomicrobium sp.]